MLLAYGGILRTTKNYPAQNVSVEIEKTVYGEGSGKS